MLTIKAEIKKGELKANGTYNVKIRFTLNRKVKRLSSSLFVSPKDLTKSGDFKKTTKIYKEIENLVQGYKNKCNEMQVDLNSYSLDDIFKRVEGLCKVVFHGIQLGFRTDVQAFGID